MDISDRIAKSYSKSPERLQNTIPITRNDNNKYKKSPDANFNKPKYDHLINANYQEKQNRRYIKSPNRAERIRKSNSPVFLQKSPHQSQNSKMLSIDLRNIKNKNKRDDQDYNPLIELTDNPRREEFFKEHSSRNIRGDVANNVKQNLLDYDFNKQYLTNPVNQHASMRRVEVEVGNLTKKSMRKLEYMNPW